ncbi:acetamidase/formamidase [Virgibacillus natechei]|uniref:Acetamidase/formamidase n=2 Tax=Virgibacillus natechei TaxID=1216297 RepID=A0ABS4IJW1_9BACI|nr:acetamidase/formamidase [Virgibacillus natechei]
MNKSQMHPISGPIYIEGAEAGDTLEVEIMDLQTTGWGWTAIIPGKGLLSEEFTEGYIRTFDLNKKTHFKFNKNITVPIIPFLGTMGVAPEVDGDHPIIPPNKFGGNIDIRHLTKGARLFLPIQVNGALFSAGDGHAAQGDGEICINGVESPLYGELKFTLHKGSTSKTPYFYTSTKSACFADNSKGFFGTTGIGPDLKKCAETAVKNMIDHLERNHSLSRKEAYILSSLTVDLKISEIVNEPNYVVSAYLPLSIFN